jgi:ABC-type Mn2+/Zn2+ transport system permease subunit
VLQLNPVLGGFAALFFGTVLVWAIEHKTRVPTEAVIGVVFSAALAAGSLLTSGEELIEALFGAPREAGRVEIVAGLGAALLVVGFLWRARSRLVIALISRDLARAAGIEVPRLDLFYLLAFALTVALGLRYLGVLLMGSLIIIPAATAKHLAGSLNAMLFISTALAVASTLIGYWAASLFHLQTGPLIIIVAAVGFFLSLVKRKAA